MERSLAAVVTAAGKSTRMKSALPKAAHKICGKPVTRWVIDACRNAGIHECVVVVGYQAELVRNALGPDVAYALQMEQLGTGHACIQALPCIPDDVRSVLVLPGDTPLITADSLGKLIQMHSAQNNSATIMSAVLEDAGHYGRIVRDSNEHVKCIREAKDASEEELRIGEFNTAIYCFELKDLRDNLALLTTDNAQGEYYLTDVISIMYQAGLSIGAYVNPNLEESLGINNREELAQAGAILKRRINQQLMLDGVTLVDPETTYIDWNVQIGPDTTIYPCTVIEGQCRIGSRPPTCSTLNSSVQTSLSSG